MSGFFPGFTRERVRANGVELSVVHGGAGDPVLLLHGYPQMHLLWHKVAPRLAERYHVVAPDLRGYGDSEKPEAGADEHAVYCKRTMAGDLVELMRHLGHSAWHVVGHDRGARVAHRMALDHPQRVRSFTSLDVVASQAAFDAMDAQLSYAWFHWHLMRQPYPLPETLIGNSVREYFDFLMERWCATPGAIPPEVYAEYVRCFCNPETVRSTCSTTRPTAAGSWRAPCWCCGARTPQSAPAGRPESGWTSSPPGGSAQETCAAADWIAATSCRRNGRTSSSRSCWHSGARAVDPAPRGCRARDSAGRETLMGGRLNERVAIVTGAGSIGPGWGNGKAAAVLYAREGARVLAVDIDPAAAEETRALIAAEGGACETFSGDVSRSDAVEALVARCIERFGRVDVLHNNVGIVEVGGPVEITEENWDRLIDVNLKSVFLTCKHCLPHMLAQGRGAIVNISSIASIRFTGYPSASYNASKGAINQLTQNIASSTPTGGFAPTACFRASWTRRRSAPM
jgi:NADP-dependent 3-hydroxy acid dehydrogenase YdfG/pimeloyl-ACP methyl ester carboxylesterase